MQRETVSGSRIRNSVPATSPCGGPELPMMRQASKLEWPDDLWHDLGFKTPADDLIPVTVRISVKGTYHRITHNYDTHPRDGEEHVCCSEIRVEIHGNAPDEEGDTLLHAATFTDQDGTLGQYSQPPSPPWHGTMDAVGCFSRIEREMRIHQEGVSEVTLNSRRITIGGQTIPWDDINAHGSLDLYYALAVFWHGEQIGGELMQALYRGDEKSTGPKRAICAALLDEIDYICAHRPSHGLPRSLPGLGIDLRRILRDDYLGSGPFIAKTTAASGSFIALEQNI